MSDAHTTLVTGAAGFIGSAVTRLLSDAGRRAVALDNLECGSTRNLPASWPESDFLECDVLETGRLAELMRARRVESVVHLAALSFIPECDADPGRVIRVNVEGTESVLEAAVQNSVRNVFFASSAAVYAPSPIPHDEEDPVGPDDIYGHTKLFGEQLVALWSRRTGGRAVIGRFSNVFGPRETIPHVISHILSSMRSSDSIRLGNLAPVRDYVFVDDVARAVLASLDAVGSGVSVFNVSSGEGASVVDLLRILSELTGRSLEPVVESARVRNVDRPRLILSNAKLKAEAAWRPQLSLPEGLRRLLADEELRDVAGAYRSGRPRPMLKEPQLH
ncbi:MAG: NAD-dependent epimerase/dehydratase family protein [Gemmatimonadota bacterium]